MSFKSLNYFFENRIEIRAKTGFKIQYFEWQDLTRNCRISPLQMFYLETGFPISFLLQRFAMPDKYIMIFSCLTFLSCVFQNLIRFICGAGFGKTVLVGTVNIIGCVACESFCFRIFREEEFIGSHGLRETTANARATFVSPLLSNGSRL